MDEIPASYLVQRALGDWQIESARLLVTRELSAENDGYCMSSGTRQFAARAGPQMLSWD